MSKCVKNDHLVDNVDQMSVLMKIWELNIVLKVCN